MKTVFLALMLTTLAACSSWYGVSRPPELPLLSPASLGQQWQLTQSVTMKVTSDQYSAQNQTLLAAWSVNPQRLDFAGLTPAGQTLLTLSYDGQKLSENTSPLLPKEVSGRDILTQLQLAYWPMNSIQKALNGTLWEIKQIAPYHRELWLGDGLRGRLILDVHISPAVVNDTNTSSQALESIIITHYVMPYQLIIKTLTKDELPKETTTKPIKEESTQ